MAAKKAPIPALPKIEPTGPTDSPLYLLGPGPSDPEISFNKQFSDGLGKTFRSMLENVGLPEPRCNYISPVLPARGKKFTQGMVKPYREQVEADILATRPKIVMAIGTAAIKWLEPDGSGTLWYKKPFAAQIGDHCFWVMPVLDLFMFKVKHATEPTREIYRTVQEAKKLLDAAPTPAVHTVAELDSYSNICMSLHSIQSVVKNNPPDFATGVVLDTETSGLELHASKLLTVALTYIAQAGTPVTIMFPVEHPEAALAPSQREDILHWAAQFLSQFQTHIFHNAPFDLAFLFRYLGESVWKWVVRDTMVQSYILDTTQGIHDLDTCARLYLNIPDFKSSSDIDVANLINEPLIKVLKYNGRDAAATLILSRKLGAKLADADLTKTYEFHCRRLRPLCQTMLRGVPLNKEEIDTQKRKADAAVTDLWDKMMSDPKVVDWRSVQGKEFNPGSWQQLQKLFVFHGLLQPGASTNEESLSTVKDPLAKWVLEWRSQKKRQDFFTTLSLCGDTAHSSFKNTNTRTGRLASSNINLQNIEKGPPRSIIRAPRGYVLVGADYKQLEACVIADTAQDKYFMQALRNGLDVHAECARELIALHKPLGGKDGIVLKDKKKFDDFRGVVKNGWVFPAFYLASTFSLANYMDMPKTKAEQYADTFWARYSGVYRWQQKTKQQYQMHGVVWGPTGRRYTGIMTPNDLANWQIQGAASDIVVEAQNRCNEAGMVANINVHDELVFVVPREDLTPFVDKLARIMLTHPRDAGCTNFEWLQTPLSISIEVGIDWSAWSPDHPTGMQELGSYTAQWH